MTEPIETEVCILGGGPAGAVAAWKLARLGHDVLVIERAAFPRSHVGEALSPGIWPQLDLLGLTDAVGAAGFRPTASAVVRWSGVAQTVRHPDPPGLVVDRGRFDHLLLEHGRAAGARILQPALALRPRRIEGGGWSVPVRTSEGGREVRARFLVDASGRVACLPGGRVPTGPPTLALHAAWVQGGGLGESTWTEAVPEGWLWAAPRPDDALSVMVFLDADPYRAARQAGTSREALYRRILESSALSAVLATSGARLAPGTGVEICDATCRHDPEPVGDGFLKIGEAAFTLDPLSSTGIQKALQTAWSGAVVVHTLLTYPERTAVALRFYAENHRSTVERHASWAAGFYSEARHLAEHPFWLCRSATALPNLGEPAPPDERVSFPDSDTGVRLSAAATFEDTPCITGDSVEMRSALSHPCLPRPVAFLDGVEIAPLLESVPAGTTLKRLAEHWSRRLPNSPPGQIAALADWLIGRGVLVRT